MLRPQFEQAVDASLLCRPSMRLMLEREEAQSSGDTSAAAAVRETARCHLIALSAPSARGGEGAVWAALAHFSTLGVIATSATAQREAAWLTDVVDDNISSLLWLPGAADADDAIRLLLVGTSDGDLHMLRVAEERGGRRLAAERVWTRRVHAAAALTQLVALSTTSVCDVIVTEVVEEGVRGEEGEVWLLFDDASLAAVPLAGLRSAAAVGAEHRARKGAAAGKDAEGERAARNPHFDGERRLDPLPLHFRWQLAGASPAAAATGDAARSGAPRASAPRAPRALLAVARVRATSLFCAKPAEVSVLLFTVTFYANHAHNLTRSPSHI